MKVEDLDIRTRVSYEDIIFCIKVGKYFIQFCREKEVKADSALYDAVRGYSEMPQYTK
jgi:hypothetical protein